MQTTSQRNYTVDTIKLIAAFFVVCIHTKTTSKLDHFEQGSFSFIVDNIARFAVPFFFMVSGYFIDFSDFKKLGKRLLTIAVVCFIWSVIFVQIRTHNNLDYPEFYFTAQAYSNDVYNTLYKVFFYGYERHLWFFPAYIIAAILLAILPKKAWLLATLAGIFYIIGISGQQLSFIYPSNLFQTPIPFQDWLQQIYFTRSGLFLAFPCMTAGWIIKQKQWQLSPLIASIAILSLFVLQYYESVSMINNFDTYTAEYYLSTILLSAAILLFATNYHTKQPLPLKLSTLSAGVYIIHPLFMYLFIICYPAVFEHDYWPFLFTPLLFILSLITAYIIKLIPGLRKLILD